MENLIITISRFFGDLYVKSCKDGVTTLEVYTENSRIYCNVFYDFDPEPLKLSGICRAGDVIKLILMPHRIELRLDDTIIDEEWPAGNRLFKSGDNLDSNCSISVEEYTEPKICVPAVTGTFTNALGWRPEENVYVGDCMPYVDEGRYHVMYLKDRHHHSSKWGLGAHQWSHISTKDFCRWDIHPTAVAINHSREGSICTGSHIRKGDVHYLYYTVRMSDKSPAPICRSISRDGYIFEKDTTFAFSLSDKYDGISARDPKIIEDKNGVYHMLLTTTLLKENKGCLAHLISRDLDKWEETENPIYICGDDTQPECPDYIEYNGYYYLIYSLHGKAYYMYSQKPFDGWQKPENSVVPCSSVPKGAVWENKIVFTGFERLDGYAGTMTFKSAINAPTGELIFD